MFSPQVLPGWDTATRVHAMPAYVRRCAGFSLEEARGLSQFAGRGAGGQPTRSWPRDPKKQAARRNPGGLLARGAQAPLALG